MSIKDILQEAATEMETLAHFADQEAWDSIINRLKNAAKVLDC